MNNLVYNDIICHNKHLLYIGNCTILELWYTHTEVMLKSRPFKIHPECWITEKAVTVTYVL